MQDTEHRDRQRDSMFLMVDLRRRGETAVQRVRVRNLSEGGMMGEGSPVPARGEAIAVDLNNIGWVEGTVAWVQDTRFGIAFAEPIDPAKARNASSVHKGMEQFTTARGAARDRGLVS